MRAERRLGPRGRVRGAAIVEYALGTLIIVMALFVPLGPGELSLVDHVLDAIRGFQSNSTYLLSLP